MGKAIWDIPFESADTSENLIWNCLSGRSRLPRHVILNLPGRLSTCGKRIKCRVARSIVYRPRKPSIRPKQSLIGYDAVLGISNVDS